ncbi:MAG: HDIG domain-containing protein [Nitrospirota bacterium]|nr:HDIG domain-containing protein [Nitrospirota bacterium]
MGSKNDTSSRLLPKMALPDQDKDESVPIVRRKLRMINVGIGTMTASLLAVMLMRESIAGKATAFLGLMLLILLVFYLFYRDMKRYRPALAIDTRKIILLAFLLLLTVILSQFFRAMLTLLAEALHMDVATVAFALPVAAGAMLVSLLLDFHLALAFSFISSLLVGIDFRGDSLMPFYYFTSSIMAALYVIRCKKRTIVIRAGAMTAVISFIAIIAIDLYRGDLLTRGAIDLAAGLVGAVLTASIVTVTLPFFEALFDIATDIKLLELLDPNHPLLKELVYKTPGTYHHSIVIGNLAEAAAESIGENPLLARVGAYYHDIGKAQKPEYFIENQRTDENKHDKLTPSMSSLIITAHVKEGVEMARRHQLPSVIVDIIGQHHGNSLIAYFYQKARELQPLTVVSEQDFRYPGPRPRTKIAAIVMLADAVEAASRTLEEPTPQRIHGLTNSVITRIFLDDQLSMCDLTLKDLREIAKSFNMILNGIFHHRIDYPGVEFPGAKKRSDHPDKKHTEESKAAVGHPGTA